MTRFMDDVVGYHEPGRYFDTCGSAERDFATATRVLRIGRVTQRNRLRSKHVRACTLHGRSLCYDEFPVRVALSTVIRCRCFLHFHRARHIRSIDLTVG